MWTIAATFFMFGVFLLGFLFGVLFGIYIAEKVRDDLSKMVGKTGKKRFG